MTESISRGGRQENNPFDVFRFVLAHLTSQGGLMALLHLHIPTTPIYLLACCCNSLPGSTVLLCSADVCTAKCLAAAAREEAGVESKRAQTFRLTSKSASRIYTVSSYPDATFPSVPGKLMRSLHVMLAVHALLPLSIFIKRFLV